ncbi:unnamed protein product [Cunninghamella echinulata]
MSDNLVYTTTENASLNNETTNNNNSNTNSNANTNTTTTANTTAPPLTLSPNVITLKEAFPDIDVEIIEVVLQNHQNNQQQRQQQQPIITSSQQYESSDPSAPPKPPRPGHPISPEEQLRLDEEFAKRLALEDERQRIYDHQLRQQRQQQYQQQQQQQQQQQEDKDGFDEFIKEIQDEIPVIKEKVIEAGNVAKKKVLDMYNQFKASRANNGNGGSGGNSMFGSSSSGSIPVSNAQYRGLPSDRDDDYLLSDDMTALHLSDQDVYAQTGARGNQRTSNNKNYYDYEGSDFQAHESIIPSNVIHVNPSPHSQQYKTTTSEAQILADEEFARQLAQNDEIWRQQQQQQSPPAMPPRQPSNIQSNLNTNNNNNNNRLSNPSVVVVAPKSPLEEFDERDNAVSKKDEDINVKSYVIGDDDDSEDGLVDLDDDDEDEDAKNQSQKPNQKTSDSPKIDIK